MKLRTRRKAAPGTEIREFVYLDEVSVESLLASVDGEILVQRTNTKSSSTESGLSGTLSGKGQFGKATFASALKQTRGTEVQELRKSVAQSAFARFRSRNYTKFALLPLESLRVSQSQRSKIAGRNAKALRRHGQGVPLGELRRGDLIEVETDLVAADIFKARTAMSAVASVVDSFPSFLSIELRDALKGARPLTALIDSLTGSAIPVVGANPSIEVVEVAGVPWLVNTVSTTSPAASSQIALESVAGQQWFWGDVGRILFKPARFRMLCRVVNPVLDPNESGSYVGSILRTIDDGLADTIDGLGSMFLGALRSGHQKSVQNKSLGGPVDPALQDYALQTLSLKGDNEALPSGFLELFGGVKLAEITVDAQTVTFRLVDQFLGPTELTEEQRAALRESIRTKHALWPWSAKPETPARSAELAGEVSYLEVAIVAVYW